MSEMNKGNFTIIDKLFADSFIYHSPFGTELRGKEDLKKFATGFVAAFLDFHMTIEDMIAIDRNRILGHTVAGSRE